LGLHDPLDSGENGDGGDDDLIDINMNAANMKGDNYISMKNKSLVGKRSHYEISICMIFALGLIERCVDHLTNSNNQEAIIFTLERLKHGEMPFLTMSRDGFRVFIESTIGLSFPSWDKFDMICQKFDPEKKGFLNSKNVILAFKKLSPVHDIIQTNRYLFNYLFIYIYLCLTICLTIYPSISPVISQNMILFTLTIITDVFVKQDKSIEQTLISLLSSLSSSVPSFNLLLTKRSKQEKSIFPSSINDKKSAGPEYLKECQFIADIIYELLKPLINTSSDSSIDINKNKLLKSSNAAAFLSILQANLKQCSLAIARGLQVYEGIHHYLYLSIYLILCITLHQSIGEQDDIITTLCTFFSTFTTFRQSCLKSLLNKHKLLDNPDIKLYKRFPSEDIEKISSNLEAFIVQTLGGIQGDKVLTWSCLPRSIEAFEYLICELIGIPIPSGGLMSLVESQCDMEYILSNFINPAKIEKKNEQKNRKLQLQKLKNNGPVHSSLSTSILAPIKSVIDRVIFNIDNISNKNKNIIRSSSPLKNINNNDNSNVDNDDNMIEKQLTDVEAKVADEAYINTMQEVRDSLGFKLIQAEEEAKQQNDENSMKKRGLAQVNSVLMDDMEKLINKQRLEHLYTYLSILNDKASKRRKILETMLHLWQVSKKILYYRSKHIKPQEYLLTKEEIIKKSVHIQNFLLLELQKPQDVKTQQLIARVEILKEAVKNGSIYDGDSSLKNSFHQITILENGIIQANSDALKLSTRIIKDLQ
jgi:hypothetical protein